MFVAGQREMQQMDRYTMEELGLPGIVLMENAGSRIVEEIIASAKNLPNATNKKPKIIILAGGGNNGGDGFVVARRLVDIGWEPALWLLVEPEKITGDAKVHLEAYIKRRLPLYTINQLQEINHHLEQADIIVDAMLGTGVKGTVREPFSHIIKMVNERPRLNDSIVISVDIPSGVNSDDGKVVGEAIRATKTISFVCPKKGFFLQDGPKYIGEWKAVDISVPPSVVQDLELKLPQLLTEPLIKKSIPVRPAHGHKGTFGHALVIGGSRSYIGAPIFTAKAALHSGAGLVTLAIPEGIYPMAAGQLPEALYLPLPETNGHFSKEAVVELIPRLQAFNSIAVGPGLSRFQGGEEWLASLMSALTTQPIVIDADALYLFRNNLKLFKQYGGPIILTPHPGEMATLLGKTVKEVEGNRLEIARKFATEHQVLLLLKGHRSIIATPYGEVFINPYGNDALGKGGSGDVLTGLITSFLAQGATPLQAVQTACYLHAKAGEEQAKVLSNYGVMPFDLIDGVKQLLAIIKMKHIK